MISRSVIRAAFACVIFAVALSASLPATAQTRFASVLEGVGRPNAVKISYPVDPCGDLYAALSSRLAETELRFDGGVLDTEPFFLHFCNEKKDEWVGQITEAVTGPITDVQTQINAAVDRQVAELTGGFWKFVAEQLYAILPPEAQAKYAPGSPELDAMAVEWLNDAPAEAQAYALAYFTTGEDRAWLLSAWKTYVDLTNGQSAEIIAGLRGLADTAQTRVNQLLRAGQELDASPPDTPTADALEKVGLSGEWMDRFKANEGQLRAINETYQLGQAAAVIYSAVGTNEPVSQVQGFLGLMRIGGEVAGTVGGPLTQFMGDIVIAYVDAAEQLLAATLALEQKINQRNGFCLGVGVPSRDPKAQYFNDKGLLACPIKYGTWPFKHIYVTQGAQDATYYFYNGTTFLEGTNGTGRAGVLAAMDLIDAGAELGYPIVRDPDGHVNLIGSVYNTSPPGGPLALMEEARDIVDEIEGGMAALRTLVAPGDRCSLDQIVGAAAAAVGETPEALVRPLAVGGDRLAKVIAASFVAFEGGFGPGVQRGGDAMETYLDLADKIGGLSVVILEGRVRDENGRPVPGAILDVSVANGEEARGCEAWQANAAGRFTITALSAGSFPVVSASAETSAGRGPTERFRRGYVRRNALFYERRDGGTTARTEIVLTVPVPQGETPETGATPPEPAPPPVTTGEPEQPEPDTPAPEVLAACLALERGILETEAQLLSGNSPAFNRVAQRLDPHAGATGQGALCDPPLADRLADLRNRIAQVERVADAARAALASCDQAALSRAAAEIAGLSGVRLTTLSDQVRQASSLIATFETARGDYRANRLAPARAGLTRVLGQSRGATPPLCPAYADRAEQGLEQIATLEAFSAQVTHAITVCDIALMDRLSAASAGRDHPLFQVEIDRIAAGKTRCAEARAREEADRVAAQEAACNGFLARLNSARADYRDNKLVPAQTALAELKTDLLVRGRQCDGLLDRVDLGLSNIAKLRGLERDLTSAVAGCDLARLDEIEATARFEGHLWFKTALGRIAAAKQDCATPAAPPTVSDPCAELSRMEGYVTTAVDRSNWSEARSLLDEASVLANMDEALTYCPEQRGRVQGAVAAVATIESALAEVERAVGTCSGDLAALAARLDGIAFNVAALDRARTRVAQAQRDCAQAEEQPVTRTPPPTTSRPTSGDSDDLDGRWRGSGQILITGDGKTFPWPVNVDVTVQNGVATGNLLFESDQMPITGRVSRDVLELQGTITKDGVTVSVNYDARARGGTLEAQGSVRMPDMVCAMSGIGAAIGGAIAGATSLGMIEEDEPEEPDCPTATYTSDWTARR